MFQGKSGSVTFPFISVIIPCRNEAKYIGPCLDSILGNDYPKDRLEIFIMDGMSEDGTRDILRSYKDRYPFITLLDNPKRSIPSALNRGLAAAKGEIVIRMDAHATYPADYLSRCVRASEKTGAENVGGKFLVLPGDASVTAKSIAMAFSHPFGIGRYYQWMRSLKSPTEVETVSFGCFRKEFLDRKKLFYDERLERGEDCEFNARLRKEGGRILLFPEIVFHYYGRTALKDLWKHQFGSGLWNLYGAKFGAEVTFCALIPLMVLVSLGGLFLLSIFFTVFRAWMPAFIFFYGLTCFVCSVQLAVQKKCLVSFFLLPLIFGVLHLSFALGSLLGFLKMWGFEKRGFTKPAPAAIDRFR